MVLRQSPAFSMLGAKMIANVVGVLRSGTTILQILAPLASGLAVTAGVIIATVVRALSARRTPILAMGLAMTVMVFSAAYGASFDAVTIAEPSEVTASMWTNEQLASGSTPSL